MGIAELGPKSVVPKLTQPKPGRLFDKDYLASNSDAVAQPGVPQSWGETPLDHFMRQQDGRIDNSIRKGC